MRILKFFYEKFTKKKAPYYFNYSILTIIAKPFRKYFTNVVAAHCPFNCIRIFIYRLCGFKIGKKCFIGMRCYLDDMCYKQLIIGNNVTISYGVFFACHGKGQKHLPIIIKDGAYIGMRSNLISRNPDRENGITVGKNAIVGACTLVNKNIPDYATAYGVPCKIILKEENEK